VADSRDRVKDAAAFRRDFDRDGLGTSTYIKLQASTFKVQPFVTLKVLTSLACLISHLLSSDLLSFGDFFNAGSWRPLLPRCSRK
jgi:hypothetical protein